MARSRNIKPGFFLNEDLVELPYEVRLLFIGLWCLADRKGRLENRPKKIKMQIFPADALDIPKALTMLAQYSLITLYTVDSVKYISINNFLKHQNPHIKEQVSTIPAPDLHGASHADSLNLIPLTPIPDPLIPDTGNPNPSQPIVELKPDDSLAVFNYWQSICKHPKAAFDDKRKALIKKQLKHYSKNDLCQAIHGCSVTPHNNGDNKQGAIYDSIELILRDASQIDRFMGNAVNPPLKGKTIQQSSNEYKTRAARVAEGMQ